MAAGNTYTQIASTTLGSAAASVTFSSIPATYTDLVVICNVQTATGGDDSVGFQFNGDTTGNYSFTYMNADGSSASSGRAGTQGSMQFGLVNSSNWGVSIGYIQNYANTTTKKTVLGRGNMSSLIRAYVGLWKATPAAINSVTILSTPNVYNFIVGSQFSLYGITAA
jgi:hypothetical protein